VNRPVAGSSIEASPSPGNQAATTFALSGIALNSNGLTNQQGRGYFLDVFTSGYLVRAARGSSVLAVFDQTNGAVYASKTIAYATTSPIRSLAVIGTNSK
jgi:hypothetical protein